MSYLVVADNRPNHYGTGSGLLYDGKTGIYKLKTQPKPKEVPHIVQRKFYHLDQNISPTGVDPDALLKAYVKSINASDADLSHFSVDRLRTKIGIQYGRISRPLNGLGFEFGLRSDETERQTLRDLYGQLDAFLYRFSDIARVVLPSESNLGAHGYEIRSSLILACTEVELLFKRLCCEEANFKSNMRDYFACERLAKLSSFEVRFNLYPSIGAIRPFEVWAASADYIPLPWYRAYNNSKHNRLDSVEQANLKHLIDALAACAVLLQAQSKSVFSSSDKSSPLHRFTTQFSIIMPKWLASEHYWVVPGWALQRRAVSEVIKDAW